MLGMLLLIVLALFTFGSGLCAVLGLVQFAMGGGPYAALAAGTATVISIVCAVAIHGLLRRLHPDDPDEPQG